MKKHIKLYPLLATILLLPACHKPVDIIVATEPGLMLMCYPGDSDTTVIQLYKAVPVGKPCKALPFLESGDIRFTVNDVERNVTHAYYGHGCVPAGCWFVTGAMEPGDIIEVRATAENIPALSARTVIPQVVKDYKSELVLQNGLESLKLSFPDNPSTYDYYGISVIEEKTLDGETSYSTLVPFHKQMQPLGGNISTDAPYARLCFNGLYLTSTPTIEAWPDKYSTKDDHFEMQFKFKDERDEDRDEMPEEASDGASYKYKICIYSLSEEFFRYAKSRESLTGIEFTSMGLAPMAVPFSNVDSGFGILAGWSMTQSDWITP